MTPTRSPTDRTDKVTIADGNTDEAVPADGETLRDGPFTATWNVTRTAETTFVTVRVTNDHPRERIVRVENRLDSVVRPPRRNGVEAPGWDSAGVTTPVPGDGTVSLGYACHAPPLEPPISVRADSPDSVPDSPVDRALRSLGDHAPPRAAVPSHTVPDTTSGSTRTDPDEASDSQSMSSSRQTSTDPPEPNESVVSVTDVSTEDPTESDVSTEDSSDSDASDERHTAANRPEVATVPMPVTAWFRAIDARVDTADRLTGPLEEATPVVASLGGRCGVETLSMTLDRDASALRAVAERALSLAARVEETDVPDLEAVE